MAKIPDPFSIKYRPPGEDYKELPEALDNLFNRLNKIEQGVDSCQQSPDEEIQ